MKHMIGRVFAEVNSCLKNWPFVVVQGRDDQSLIRIQWDGADNDLLPSQVLFHIIADLIRTAENRLGCKVRDAGITISA